MAKDPICGMEVDEGMAVKVTKNGREYFFCSDNCRDKFLKKPFFKNKLFLVSSVPVILILVSFWIPFFKIIFVTFAPKRF